MFSQWIVDSAHDYYQGETIPELDKKVINSICNYRKAKKSIRQIRDRLMSYNIKVSRKDIRGVLIAYQQETGDDLNVSFMTGLDD